jgi:O-antigen/teichoic acid export membrane protein
MIKKLRSLLFTNQNVRQTVVKNTFWLTFGIAASRLIKSAIVIYAARILGAEGYGLFAYVVSLATIFTTFMDFGMNSLITRESAKDLSVQQKYFATGLGIKTAMFVVIVAIVALLAPLFIRQQEVVALLPIVIIMIGLDGFRDFAASLSRAWEKMEVEAFVQIFTNAMIVIGGFIALFITKSPLSLAIGYTAGVGVGMLWAFKPYGKYIANARRNFSPGLIKKILVSCWPYGMLGLMGVIMLNTDTIMIGWFKDITNVGYYSAGQRIVQLLYGISGIISAAFFPSMVKLSQEREKFRILVERALSIMLMAALPITLGGMLLAKPIIYLLFGDEYLPATLSFIFMNLTYLPIFFTAILSNAVFALNQERKLFTYVILGIVGNLVFNLVLIPLIGIAGAALSTVINQMIITVYLILKLKKSTPFSAFANAGKPVLATVGMCIIVLALQA